MWLCVCENSFGQRFTHHNGELGHPHTVYSTSNFGFSREPAMGGGETNPLSTRRQFPIWGISEIMIFWPIIRHSSYFFDDGSEKEHATIAELKILGTF
jgi:hypothetical protein